LLIKCKNYLFKDLLILIIYIIQQMTQTINALNTEPIDLTKEEWKIIPQFSKYSCSKSGKTIYI
jgi:hypothetical protein